MSEISKQYWDRLYGTFSVKDHCRQGAFVAEVLLYDKLIIPVVPTTADGLSDEDAKVEWDRWVDADWNPQRQTDIRRILNSDPAESENNAAETIPWTAARVAEWQALMKNEFAEARKNGYFVTGSSLQRFAPAMAKTVVAVSQYHAVKDLKNAGIRPREPEEKLPASSLLAVVGHELLVPDDSNHNEFETLREAVEVSRNYEYRNRRRALYDWQQKFLSADGLTDATSIKAALNEMSGLVDGLKTATARQTKWKWVKRFFTFLEIAAKGAEMAGPSLTMAAGAGGVIASIGTFVVTEATADRGPQDPALPAATLILDAREKLGIE